jgi:hypothetical protein
MVSSSVRRAPGHPNRWVAFFRVNLRLKSWLRIVICYWLLLSAIFFLEFKYLRSDWAGLPSFVFTLPLSVIVVTIGFLAEPTAARFGREIVITDYFFEYGFMICAFLNAFFSIRFICFGKTGNGKICLYLRHRHPTNRWTRAAIACFAS